MNSTRNDRIVHQESSRSGSDSTGYRRNEFRGHLSGLESALPGWGASNLLCFCELGGVGGDSLFETSEGF